MFSNAQKKKAGPVGPAFWGKAPGDDLLLHGLSHTTIGACAFHFRVRNGIGWDHTAIVTRERVEGRGFGGLNRAHALVGLLTTLPSFADRLE